MVQFKVMCVVHVTTITSCFWTDSWYDNCIKSEAANSSAMMFLLYISRGLEHFPFLQLYLQIVDIKNSPYAVPKENVYVWFTKNQSATVPCSAQKVFSMVRLEPFSLKSCLLEMKVKYAKLQIGSCSRSQWSHYKDIFNYSFRSDSQFRESSSFS